MRKREWSIKTERDFLAYISLLIAENAGFKYGSRLGFCIFQIAWSKNNDTYKTRRPAAFALRKKNIGSRVWYLSFGCSTRRIKLPHVWSMFSGRFTFFDNIIMVVFIIIFLAIISTYPHFHHPQILKLQSPTLCIGNHHSHGGSTGRFGPCIFGQFCGVQISKELIGVG